jgi:hypothetical protein
VGGLDGCLRLENLRKIGDADVMTWQGFMSCDGCRVVDGGVVNVYVDRY